MLLLASSHADHPLVVQYTDKAATFASAYQSYLLGFAALLVQLFVVSASTKRNEQRRLARNESARLQDRANRVAAIKASKMIDLGLGNGMGGGAKKEGFGEVEVQWGKEK